VAAPRLRGELAVLGDAVTKLRNQLDGKTYVEGYVHSLTHEMKSPVAAIRGAAELLDEEMTASERARFLANIRAETERLQQVIDRALDLARLEQRQALETREPIDLGVLADELLAAKAPAVKARALTIERRLDAAVVLGDPFLVRQAVSNLLDNAVAFASSGGTVSVATRVEQGRCRIAIRNSGSAIPPFAQERLFERFYSLARPDTGQKSTGLGLPFVKEVAALHDGEIRVANDPEGGVIAELVFPTG